MPSYDVNNSNLRHLMEYYARKFTMAEQRLIEALPGWIAEANSLPLKVVLRSYLCIVQKQVKKMEQFFAEEKILFDGSQASRSLQDFVVETNMKISHSHNNEEKDAQLLAALSAVNQFKINMYEMGAGFARSLGLEHAAFAFEDAGIHEKFIYDNLRKLAETTINLSLVEPVHIPG